MLSTCVGVSTGKIKKIEDKTGLEVSGVEISYPVFVDGMSGMGASEMIKAVEPKIHFLEETERFIFNNDGGMTSSERKANLWKYRDVSACLDLSLKNSNEQSELVRRVASKRSSAARDMTAPGSRGPGAKDSRAKRRNFLDFLVS